MSRYKPTKKRSGLVEVKQYCYNPRHGIFGQPRILPYGKCWAKKGTVLPIIDLHLESLKRQNTLVGQMLDHFKIKT